MRFKSAAMRPTLRYTSWWIFDHAPQCTVTSTFQLRHVDRLDSMKVPVRLIRHLTKNGGMYNQRPIIRTGGRRYVCGDHFAPSSFHSCSSQASWKPKKAKPSRPKLEHILLLVVTTPR